MDEEDPEELYKRIESLEIEKSLLSQQVKDVENALCKQKIFHRKFVADVTEAEEMRIKDFNNETKELHEENKRLKAEIRDLAKEKAFYQAAYNSFAEEDDTNNPKMRSNNISQSTSEPVQHQHPYNTRRSSTNFHPSSSSSLKSNLSISEVAIHSTRNKNKSLKEVTKLSEKWFKDYKKMKLKLLKLSGDNTHLKLKVKKLENFKNSVENKKITQEAHRSELQNLSKQTVRTNEQIFNADAIAKLGKLLKDSPP